MTVVVATLSCKNVIRRTHKMSIFSLGKSKFRKMVLTLTDDYYLSWKGLKKALISSSTVSQDKAVLWHNIGFSKKKINSKKNVFSKLFSFVMKTLYFVLEKGHIFARGVSYVCDGKNLRKWSRLQTRMNVFRQSTISEKQFIIIS